MRLLDVHTLTLKQFNKIGCPPYAILSHTWGDGEVSLQDLATPAAVSMAGHVKITKCCEQAIQDGFEYAWVDTCCIDKTSSAELSEAINSMYDWYKDAWVCYAFLSDVKIGSDKSHLLNTFGLDPLGTPEPWSSPEPESTNTVMRFDEPSLLLRSRWFTRGWTLQELLAPRSIVFYDCDWVEIGTKASLITDLSKITNIPIHVLDGSHLGSISVAQRMSWAAMRETTREEDLAYCLMGIFGVNMPLLYGEGRKAFLRLQQEIMRLSDDHSLFAWVSDRGSNNSTLRDFPPYTIDSEELGLLTKFMDKSLFINHGSGMLASSPKDFRYASQVTKLGPRSEEPTLCDPQPPYSVTNTGIHIWLPLVQMGSLCDADGHELMVYKAIINCEIEHNQRDLDDEKVQLPLNIYLTQNPSGRYSRFLHNVIGNATGSSIEGINVPTELYIEDPQLAPVRDNEISFQHVLHASIIGLASRYFRLLEVGPSEKWVHDGPSTATFTLNPTFFTPFYMKESGMIVLGTENDPGARAIVAFSFQLEESYTGDTAGHHDKLSLSCGIYFASDLQSHLGRADEHLTLESYGKYHANAVRRPTQNLDRAARVLTTATGAYLISVSIRPGPPSGKAGSKPGTQNYRLVINIADDES